MFLALLALREMKTFPCCCYTCSKYLSYERKKEEAIKSFARFFAAKKRLSRLFTPPILPVISRDGGFSTTHIEQRSSNYVRHFTHDFGS